MKTIFLLNHAEITQANILAISDIEQDTLISLKNSNGVLRLHNNSETKYLVTDIDLRIQNNAGYSNVFKSIDLIKENYVACFLEIAPPEFEPPMGGDTYLIRQINDKLDIIMQSVDTLKMRIETTGTIPLGTTFTTNASGVDYTKTMDTVYLGATDLEFNSNNNIHVFLNGVLQEKGYDILYVDTYSFNLNKIVDSGDIIIIKKG